MNNLTLSLTLAAATVFGGLALPASAGSNALVLQVNPSNRSEARVMRHALSFLSVLDGARSNAHVNQQGSNNAAAITQQGRGSAALIQQHGNGHSGSVTQRGNNHSYGLFQFGEATNHHVTQQGRGGTGMTFVIGF